MKRTFLIISLMIFVTGCAVRGPSVKVRPPSIELEGVHHRDSYDNNYKPRGHCPPGLAKQGRC
ncbi:MAG: membrane lipoprotein lipid attachment site-containing protein [Methylococcales bacterium]|nr:membrane lipoprotein lipid attachment site-containing protein [Methylococcales bacterium]